MIGYLLVVIVGAAFATGFLITTNDVHESYEAGLAKGIFENVEHLAREAYVSDVATQYEVPEIYGKCAEVRIVNGRVTVTLENSYDFNLDVLTGSTTATCGQKICFRKTGNRVLAYNC